ncbi:MAG: glycosyltransferase [Pseudomonadota bacterium]
MFFRSHSAQRSNEVADRLRDERRWTEAALAYAEVLKTDSRRSDIWVQYGHCLKESGNLPAAKQAYEKALSIDAAQADTWLQLGHANKLLGNSEDALKAYAAALQRQPNLVAAIQEIARLGSTSDLGLEEGRGAAILEDTLDALARVRQALNEIESSLPPITALNSFAADKFSLFCRYFRTPMPETRETLLCHAVVLSEEEAIADVWRTVRSLRAQESPPHTITVLTGPQSATNAAFEGAELHCRNGSSIPDALLSIATGSIADILVVVRAGVVCDPQALAWLRYAFYQTDADVAVADEIVEAGPLGQMKMPVLRQCPTADTWLETVCDSALLGLRLRALRRIAAGKPFAQCYSDWLASLQGLLVPCHVPHFLAISERPCAVSREAMARTSINSPSEPRSRICLIVPTRNLAECLETCLSSARATARHPDLLQIVVIDNQSNDEGTLAYLRREMTAGTLVVRNEEPFNWSRLSNQGARETDAQILLFANNDIEFRKLYWDEILRSTLQSTDIGAVGARLLYPDGAVQHAGVVFRPHGLPEHEGRFAAPTAEGPGGRWMKRRHVCAVTGAFLAVRRADFFAVEGFDEVNLPIWFSDFDLCLKLRAHSSILYEPALELIHHESKTIRTTFDETFQSTEWQRSADYMRLKWGRYLHFDPSYNPHYASWGIPFRHIVLPSLAVTANHIALSARENPWRAEPNVSGGC